MDKRKLFLVLWLVGMIFPLNLVWELSYHVRRVFDALISSELSHVIGHLILFSGLVFLLMYIFELAPTRRSALILTAVVLAVGLLQEYFQLQVKHRPFGPPEIFDLGVDLIGGMIGWMLYRYYLRYSRYLRIAYFILRDA